MMRSFSLIAISSLLTAQDSPPVKQVTPVTPVRVRVGCQAQSPYLGPARRWFVGNGWLSEEQIAKLQEAVAANPQDSCARGHLIAFGQGRVPRRMDHVIWMIENDPQWDGFMLGLSAIWRGEEGEYDRVRAAWFQQLGPDQPSGAVLHHAAIFFETREPELAVDLLQRAIRLEPEVPYHLEGLGLLYGRAVLRPADPSFAERAQTALLSSDSWLVVAGALNAFSSKPEPSAFRNLLLTKLTKLTGNRDQFEVLWGLPSRSAQYNLSPCGAIALVRCADSRHK